MARELDELTSDVANLARDAKSLRDECSKEQGQRQNELAKAAERLQAVELENKELHEKLQELHSRSSVKLGNATALKRSVVAKTMELEKRIKEFQQAHQESLHSRISGITGDMRALCTAKPQPPESALNEQVEGSEAPPPAESEQSGAAALDSEAQRALKKRLQALGDVVVFASGKFEACSASGRPIRPGALRIRPRRCDHVFLIETLMPYWADGLCPVCRCSFALEAPQDGANDEWDRCSSVSTSVSQLASLAQPRLPGQRLPHGGGANSSRGGPRSAARGRAQQVSRQSGGGHHTSLSRGARSDASAIELSASLDARRCASPNDRSASPRSASNFSRTSSAAPRRSRSVRPL